MCIYYVNKIKNLCCKAETYVGEIFFKSLQFYMESLLHDQIKIPVCREQTIIPMTELSIQFAGRGANHISGLVLKLECTYRYYKYLANRNYGLVMDQT